MKNNIIIIGVVVIAVLLSGCATTSTNTKQGAGVGAVIGGVAGALIDKDNPWRGGVVGAFAGALIGGAVGSISDRAAEEAVMKDRPVAYMRTLDDGTQETIRATPLGYSTDGNYNLVKTQIIRNGVVVSEEVKRVPIE
jgi:hypothetical protein